jgi:hypothetical protein
MGDLLFCCISCEPKVPLPKGFKVEENPLETIPLVALFKVLDG